MAEPFLSRFTPSLMSPEALEAIFVQREPLAQRLVDLIRESAASRSSQHTLLIGPRGIGKSHLVALVYHRLRNDGELRDRLLVAWLREEEWGVGSFLDLLIRILQALRFELGEAGLEELSSLYDFAPAEAERRAVELLSRHVGERTLLIIVENLDDIFAGLGSAEQRRLRAFLQEHNRIPLLATSQSLFNGVSLQTSPFYGFFRIHHLDELEFQDAVRLLVQIAEFTGKPDLAASLQTPEGRARIRAVHHLAGGNPRVYVVFSQFLTRDSLEALVDPFMRLLDDLTPYYQSRMAWISPQQRKIVDFLCDRRGAVAVKEIARHCFISHQTTSSQLKALKELGYVSSVSAGRESYYELREPLMRVCMEVKRQHGEPIKLFVEFLRLWYSPGELQGWLDTFVGEAVGESHVDLAYILQALRSRVREGLDPRIAACLNDFNQAFDRNDLRAALEVAEDMIVLEGWPEVTSGESEQYGFLGLRARALVLLEMGRLEEAMRDAEATVRHNPSSWLGWYILGRGRLLRGESRESLEALLRVIDLGHDDGNLRVMVGKALLSLNRWQDAMVHLDRAIELDAEDYEAWRGKAIALHSLGRRDELLGVLERCAKFQPARAILWLSLGLDSIELRRGGLVRQFFDRARAVARENMDIDSAWKRIKELMPEILASEDGMPGTFQDLALVLLDYVFGYDPVHQEKVVKGWVVHAQVGHFLTTLALGLVRSGLLFRTSNLPKAKAWLKAWKKAGAGVAELAVPLRLLESTLRYLESGDERVLLELPVEERRIVEALLGGGSRSKAATTAQRAAG